MIAVRDLMTSEPVVVRHDESLAACAHHMEALRIRHLPVVDERGTLVGAVLDAALFQRGSCLGPDRIWTAWDPRDFAARAGDLATPVHVVVEGDHPAKDALDRLLRTPQDALVVVDAAHRPVGIVTEHDVVGIAAEVVPEDRLALRLTRGALFAIDVHASAREAWRLMDDHRVRHVLVQDAGRLVGVVAWRDLVREDVVRGRQLAAGDLVVAQHLVTAIEGTPLREIATRMIDHKVGCVPLVDFAGRPVGVITRKDLLARVVTAL